MVEGRVEVAAGLGLEERVGGAVEVVPDVAPLVVDVVVPAVPLAVVDAAGGTPGVAPSAGAVLFLGCSAVRRVASSR